MTAQRLEDKVALITGSDSGIGQATAMEFARQGADIVVNYLHDREGAEKTSAAVTAEGRRVLIVRADVSDEDQVADMFDPCCGRLRCRRHPDEQCWCGCLGFSRGGAVHRGLGSGDSNERVRPVLLLSAFCPAADSSRRRRQDHQRLVGACG